MTGREKIVQAALHLFETKGFYLTSVDEIAAAAGVSKGLTFHHFGGKQDLLREIVRLRLTELDGLVDALRAEPSPQKRLDLFARQFIADLRDNQPKHRFMITTYLQPDQTPLVAQMMRDHADHFAALHREETRLLADLGFADPAAELLLFRAAFQGMAVLYLLNPDTWPLDKAVQAYCNRLLSAARTHGDT